MSFFDALSAIGEVVVSKFIDFLVDKLGSSDLLQFATETEIHEATEKLKAALLDIRAVLDDAEERQLRDESVKIWLSDLRNLAYDVDDVLDEFATEILRRNLLERRGSSSKKPRLISTDSYKALMFNRDMMSKINDVTARLKDLEPQREQLEQRMLKDCHRSKKMLMEQRLSTSVEIETRVFGRDKDKEMILELLLKSDDEASFVIPIVGMGGIGKTTLAQSVYNDAIVQNHFSLKAWVCISDDFDVRRITKAILQSISSEPCSDYELPWLQEKLQKELSGKKFLIVLDDVWNEDYGKWISLQAPFLKGIPGSKIIVTTRNLAVSAKMGAYDAHVLQVLSDDDCLSIFSRHALPARGFEGHPHLKEVARKIVRKCDGLPLAARTIGGLLRTNVEHDAWEDVLESEIWQLSEQHQCGMIPALQLSYHHLPPHLKRCFEYCSIFPKDYEFEEEEMILLWRAEGFLQVEAVKQTEDWHKTFQELVSRSFFERSSQGKSLYVMHDLIHDLAQSAAKDLCFRVEGDEELNISNHARHSSYITSRLEGNNKFRVFYGKKGLRTFLPLQMSDYKEECYISNQVFSDLLPKLKYLRVFSLQWYQLTELPDVIGDLIHLRYINFSHTPIKTLHDSICKLYNLETLNLLECSFLEELPSKMRDLLNLRHLDLIGTSSLTRMPMGIGELTNLQTLSKFVVSDQDCGLQLSEMENLCNLRGGLIISGLENVVKAQGASAAQLYDKSNISDLTVKWNLSDISKPEEIQQRKDVLDSLRPHSKLKKLSIIGYEGETFPNWIGDPSFEKLSHLTLHDCLNCTSLPAIGKLPLLKCLSIERMWEVITVGANFFGENVSMAFPKLEKLFLKHMPKWKEWDPCEVDEHVMNFPNLRVLSIFDCPKLATYPPPLKKLEIRGCKQLVVSLPNLPILSELNIVECQEVVATSSTKFGSTMKMVSLVRILKFTSPVDMMLGLRKSESLIIGFCDELISSWQNQEGSSTYPWPLHSLQIGNSSQLVSIGAEDEMEEQMQLGIPRSIKDLRISNCERLERLSKSLGSYTSLAVLEIGRCPRLISISYGKLPPNLRRFSILCCQNLQYLLDESEDISLEELAIGWCPSLISLSTSGELPVRLQYVEIWNCEKLASLSSNGKLPMGLKYLRISKCRSLESIAPEIQDNSSLEKILISCCDNFRSLPHGLDKLNHLEKIFIKRCPNLISLPNSMHNIISLEEFELEDCPSVVSFPEEGFPTNLISLEIAQPNILMSVMEWGLHKLTALKILSINGACLDAVTFPYKEMQLPRSLTSFTITDFPNLENLSSKGFQNLTSLQSLIIRICPKLKVLPEKEMLPSLLELKIIDCPLLKEQCKKNIGPQWPNIAHVPFIEIRNSGQLPNL